MANSSDQGDDAKRRPRLPRPTTYDVGYGKPPATTRFKEGQSGNPTGRPRGARNQRPALHEERLKAIILTEAYRTIKVNDGDKQIPVPMAQAIVRSMAVTAAKGNTRAQRLFAELLATAENTIRQRHDEWLETAITYKAEWESELERRRAFGIVAPDPLPHPDDIIVDFRTNTIRIRGPMSKEELRELEHFLCRRAEFEAELEWSQKSRRKSKNTNLVDILEKEISHNTRILEIIGTIIDQRASPSCVQRLIANKQVIIDPKHHDPEVQAMMQKRAKHFLSRS